MIKEIVIFGSNCNSCKLLKSNVENVAKELNLNVEIIKKEGLDEAFKAGVTQFPGLVIDGEVISCGLVLDREDIIEIFEEILDESN